MYRVLTSSNRAIAQSVVRSTLTFTRAASNTDPEAGSASSGKDAFSKKEKAEETRWARRFEAEQAAKYRATRNQSTQAAGQPTGNPPASGQQQSSGQASQDSVEQEIAALEAEKRRITQEIAQLKRSKR